MTTLDASVGGLGGCPFAPRATGNIATEDLVYMLEGDGVETGVDLDELISVSEWLEGLLGRQLEGQVYRAGSFPLPVALYRPDSMRRPVLALFERVDADGPDRGSDVDVPLVALADLFGDANRRHVLRGDQRDDPVPAE